MKCKLECSLENNGPIEFFFSGPEKILKNDEIIFTITRLFGYSLNGRLTGTKSFSVLTPVLDFYCLGLFKVQLPTPIQQQCPCSPSHQVLHQ